MKSLSSRSTNSSKSMSRPSRIKTRTMR